MTTTIDHPGRVIDPAAGVPLPEVTVGIDGSILLRLSPDQAEVLAKMPARWESLMTMSARTLLDQVYEDTTDPMAPALYGIDQWDPAVWLNVMVSLLATRAQATNADTVPVFAVRPGPQLHALGGGDQ